MGRKAVFLLSLVHRCSPFTDEKTEAQRVSHFLIYSLLRSSVSSVFFRNPCVSPIKKNIPWPFEDCDRVPFCPTGDLLVELGVAAAM